MTTTLNKYKGLVISHTIDKIDMYQKDFEVDGFTQYQSGKKEDYWLLAKYFKQNHKGVRVTLGEYGVELSIKKGDMTGVVVLTYCQDELIYTHQNNVLNKYLEQSVTEFLGNEWMKEVTDKQIDEVIDLHFNLSNYIKKYKTAMWVTLMVKVVETHDFYEEFLQGMDSFTKLELMWNYTSNGLTVYHEDDSYQIDDSRIILQEDRLTVIEGFFQYINYIKTKYYQVEVTDEEVIDCDGLSEDCEDETLTIAQAFEALEVTRNKQFEEPIDVNEPETEVLGSEDVMDREQVTVDEQGEELTEQVLADLQTQQEEEYLNNLKKGKVPEFQTVKINEEGTYMHPIQGTSYLSKLKADLATAIIVYKDGKEIVNTLDSMGWSKRNKDYNDSVLDGVEQVIKKYGVQKMDVVFNKDYKDVQLRIDRGSQVDEVCVICTPERQLELEKQDEEVIIIGNGVPSQVITGWFQVTMGW